SQREQNTHTGELAAAALQIQLVHGLEPVQQDSHAQKKRGFDEPMSGNVERGASQRAGLKQRKAGDERSHVADGRERQQAFEMSLCETEQPTDDRGDGTEGEEEAANSRLVRLERSGKHGSVDARDGEQTG